VSQDYVEKYIYFIFHKNINIPKWKTCLIKLKIL